MTFTSTIKLGVASIPEREQSLEVALDSLYNQVGKITVYLNGYPDVPQFLKRGKIKVLRSQAYGNRGDAGKFFTPGRGYNFHADDDLIYPPDYVEKTLAKLEEYKHECAVSYHGRILYQSPVQSYYRDAFRVYHCLKDQPEDAFAQFAGTGALAYHSSTIMPRRSDFRAPNMADIWFGLLAQKREVPLLIAAHRAGWIRDTKLIKPGATIYQKEKNRDELQTSIVNSRKWVVFQPREKMNNVNGI
jgi:hypothetical protein